jgi:hypothetical protein
VAYCQHYGGIDYDFSEPKFPYLQSVDNSTCLTVGNVSERALKVVKSHTRHWEKGFVSTPNAFFLLAQ